jgi:hypothetical protein
MKPTAERYQAATKVNADVHFITADERAGHLSAPDWRSLTGKRFTTYTGK